VSITTNILLFLKEHGFLLLLRLLALQPRVLNRRKSRETSQLKPVRTGITRVMRIHQRPIATEYMKDFEPILSFSGHSYPKRRGFLSDAF
jgi:hypothetical protein